MLEVFPFIPFILFAFILLFSFIFPVNNITKANEVFATKLSRESPKETKKESPKELNKETLKESPKETKKDGTPLKSILRERTAEPSNKTVSFNEIRMTKIGSSIKKEKAFNKNTMSKEEKILKRK
jgi:hypothetical protein